MRILDPRIQDPRILGAWIKRRPVDLHLFNLNSPFLQSSFLPLYKNIYHIAKSDAHKAEGEDEREVKEISQCSEGLLQG